MTIWVDYQQPGSGGLVEKLGLSPKCYHFLAASIDKPILNPDQAQRYPDETVKDNKSLSKPPCSVTVSRRVLVSYINGTFGQISELRGRGGLKGRGEFEALWGKC